MMTVRKISLALALTATSGVLFAEANDNLPPHNVEHSFDCTMKPKATYEDLFEASANWLTKARQQNGGAKTEVHLQFPLAGLEGIRPFKYVVISPNLGEWGDFYDHYLDSGAEDADEPWEKYAECTDSTLYMNWDIQAIE